MSKIVCDLCGGSLVVNAGGKSAICKNCGMEYSIERVREMWKTDHSICPSGNGQAGQMMKMDMNTRKAVSANADSPGSLRLPMDQIAEAVKNAQSQKYQLIAKLAYKIAKIIDEDFRDYEVEYMVEVAAIDPYVRQALPIHFLFRKNGKPILAVVSATVNGYRVPRMEAASKACERAGIRYMRFFCDGRYPNEPEYIRARMKGALDGGRRNRF